MKKTVLKAYFDFFNFISACLNPYVGHRKKMNFVIIQIIRYQIDSLLFIVIIGHYGKSFENVVHCVYDKSKIIAHVQ